MTEQEKIELELLALRVRAHIISMATDGGCFIGASLSCADLIVYLYAKVLRLSPENLKDQNRDYFFLSKGHDVPALYGTFAELGYMEKERLTNHLHTNDSIYWHPNRTIPGVEFHSGSLGHLLSVAIGVALDIKMRKGNNRVFVILGDGELNEGSIWEGCLVAAALKLDNLVAVVDRNEFQANMKTEELIPLESIDKKFAAFGWSVNRINGHSFDKMEAAFSRLPMSVDRPNVIIADTIRGKGLASIERRADRWFANFTHDEIEMLLDELYNGQESTLSSETLMVR
ncbi:MAG TPA: thiamine pyrophosphate-dependent enzyme [Bacteroidota bacterium]|nr:thiamine pyrophosphate-dependent enzyme [Bacteroidota bacterium]